MQTNDTIQQEETTIDIRQYFALFRQWIWLIALVGLISGGAAYAVSRLMTPVYQATTTILINEAPSTKTTDYTAIMTNERAASTYAQLMQKRPVLQGVIDHLHLKTTPENLLKVVDVSLVRDTQLIEVKVEDTNPSQAAKIANVLVEVFSKQVQDTQEARYAASKQGLQSQMDDLQKQINTLRDQLRNEKNTDEIKRLEDQINQYQQSYRDLSLSYEQVRLTEAQTISSAVQVEEAVAPDKPVRPKVIQNTIIAILLGFILAVGGILLMDTLDDTIKNPEEITRRLNIPIMAMIAMHEQDPSGPITLLEPRSPVSEAFRALRTNVQYAGVDKPMQRILVTSTTPSDGKTTVSSNLATVMAQSGKRVVLVDADLRRPRMHKVMGVDNHSGLSTLFVQAALNVNAALQPSKTKDLYLLASGSVPPNPSELLGSHKMQEILEKLQAQSDTVIIDTPPVLTVTDTMILAPKVDGVLLVVKPGVTNKTAFKQAVEQLRRVGANVIGVILNQVEQKNSRYGYYYKSYYSYGYYEGASEKNGGKNRKGKTQKAEMPAD